MSLHLTLSQIHAGLDASPYELGRLTVTALLTIVRPAAVLFASAAMRLGGHLTDLGILAGLEARLANLIRLVLALSLAGRLLAALVDALTEEILRLLITDVGRLARL